ncbi:MAG TPA: hypothetical protein DHU55_16130 [Blastocatellia bacterium]|nr:hypothetical protein [Blastocatellia bacterium]
MFIVKEQDNLTSAHLWATDKKHFAPNGAKFLWLAVAINGGSKLPEERIMRNSSAQTVVSHVVRLPFHNRRRQS